MAPRCVAVLAASLLFVIACSTRGVSAVTDAADVAALKNLYTALGSPPSLASWADPILSLDPCNGTGPTVPNINCTLVAAPASYVITSINLLNTGPYSGVVPTAIGSFPSLQSLYLTGLQFSGLPTSIGGLQSLQILAIDNNVMSTLPTELVNIKNLTSLTLGGNRFQTLPAVIPQLTNLVRLDLSYNEWQSVFPQTLNSLQNLQAFIAQSANIQTAFGGPYFPSWLLSLGNLREIILDYNPSFGATLNGTLGSLPQLGYFSCVQCGLTGTIPANFGEFQYLGALHLSNNYLNGTIPPPLGNLSFYLHDLKLDHNNLTGPIPPELAQLQTIYLDLSYNDLNGTIPLEFYNATGQIFLQGNNLSGPLPYFLSSTVAQFTYSNNSFCSGVVGQLCGNVTDSYILRTLRYSLGNPPLLQNWTGDAPCNSSWPLITCNSTTGASAIAVNASRVQALGVIPVAIGGLKGLQSLDLSYNNIYGSIPSSMGNLTSLTSLFLEHNNMSGAVPPSLAALPSLQTVDLSYNHFTGSLPLALANVTNFNNQTALTSSALAPALSPLAAVLPVNTTTTVLPVNSTAAVSPVNTTAAKTNETLPNSNATLPLLNLTGRA